VELKDYSLGVAEFPESKIWLWRDYDPGRREQDYSMEPSERAKPQFRVSVTNPDDGAGGDLQQGGRACEAPGTA
jgi:hypothetical protein